MAPSTLRLAAHCPALPTPSDESAISLHECFALLDYIQQDVAEIDPKNGLLMQQCLRLLKCRIGVAAHGIN